MKPCCSLIILFLLTPILSRAQDELNGYRSILIQQEYFADTSADNKVAINAQAKTIFEQLGFVCYDDILTVSEEMITNKCTFVRSKFTYSTRKTKDPRDVVHSFFVVTMKIMDCNDSTLKEVEELEEYPGTSWGLVYSKAVRKMAKSILASHYKYDPAKANTEVKPLYPPVENTGETEESLTAYFSTAKLDPIEGIYEFAFKANTIFYLKIGIKKYGKDYKVIIINNDFKGWKTGEVKAYIRPDTARKGTFPMKWYNLVKIPVETSAEYKNGLLGLVMDKGKFPKVDAYIKIFPKN
jgi:hypothetical protein